MLRPATDADSADVLRWRNHPEVRAVSLTRHEISEQEHEACWAATQASDDPGGLRLRPTRRRVRCRHLLRHRPGGRQRLVGLLPRQRRAEGAGELLPAWIEIQRQAKRLAFDELGLSTLEGEVLEANEAVRRFNRRNGFEEIDRYTHDIDGVATPVLRVRATKD